MSRHGWTWGDLAGELYARGIDPDSVTDAELNNLVDAPSPEVAARCYSQGVPYTPPQRYRDDEPDREP